MGVPPDTKIRWRHKADLCCGALSSWALVALLVTNDNDLRQLGLSQRHLTGVILISGAFGLLEMTNNGKGLTPIRSSLDADASPARFVPNVAETFSQFHLLVGDGGDEKLFRPAYY